MVLLWTVVSFVWACNLGKLIGVELYCYILLPWAAIWKLRKFMGLELYSCFMTSTTDASLDPLLLLSNEMSLLSSCCTSISFFTIGIGFFSTFLGSCFIIWNTFGDCLKSAMVVINFLFCKFWLATTFKISSFLLSVFCVSNMFPQLTPPSSFCLLAGGSSSSSLISMMVS